MSARRTTRLRRQAARAGAAAAGGVLLVLATAAPAFAGPGGLKVNVDCVWHNPDGSMTSVWDYTNTNGPQDVPAGSMNSVSPDPGDRGQPTHFLAGTQHNVWAVTSRESSLTWQVLDHSDTATLSTSPACSTNPVPVVGDWRAALVGSAVAVPVVLLVVRRNRRLRSVLGPPRLPGTGGR